MAARVIQPYLSLSPHHSAAADLQLGRNLLKPQISDLQNGSKFLARSDKIAVLR